jgi:hypothetical protein
MTTSSIQNFPLTMPICFIRERATASTWTKPLSCRDNALERIAKALRVKPHELLEK